MDERDEAFDAPAAVASLPGLFAARDLAGVAHVLVRIDWPLGRIPPWGGSYARQVRDITADDAAELIHLIAREVRGSGAYRPAVLLCELSRLLPDEAALAQLARLAARVTYRGTLAQLDRALETRAAELGVSREQIEELAVPDFGLTEVGRRVERFGGARAEVVVRGRAVDLTWRTEAGKVVKSAPARVRGEFASEVKELKSEVADIEKMMTAQAERLERLFLARRSWEFARWAEYYLDHPLVGTLARRLIWTIGDVAVCYADGGLRTIADAALVPAPDARVELWHPVGREMAEIRAWQDWLEQHQVTQPFKQAHREVYPITVAEQGTGTYSNRFAAHILRQHQFHALAARNLSIDVEHQATKTWAAVSSCDSMVGRGWLIQVLRGSWGALGGRRNLSGRAA